MPSSIHQWASLRFGRVEILVTSSATWGLAHNYPDGDPRRFRAMLAVGGLTSFGSFHLMSAEGFEMALLDFYVKELFYGDTWEWEF